MKDCIFCKIVAGEIPSERVYEDEHCIAFLDIRPVSKHHALVIPKKHFENIFDIPVEQLAHVTRVVKNVVDMYREKHGMKNVRVTANSGAAAGQEVFHLHFHVIPH